MKLHGNAALSPKQRLMLCRRVVEEGWTLTAAAEAAEVSVRTARKWVRRYRGRGRGRACWIAPRRRTDQPDAHRRGSGRRRSRRCGGCG